MTSNLLHKRPNYEEILKRKNLWVLNEEEFEIDEKLKKELILKLVDETVFFTKVHKVLLSNLVL
jgi:hypothetical protein